jgi:transposase
VLTEVTWAIEHTKDNYLAVQYHRLARRLGKSKAVITVAHSVLVIVYHILRDGSTYKDLGAGYFDELDKERLQRHHVRRLEQLGYAVTLASSPAA